MPAVIDPLVLRIAALAVAMLQEHAVPRHFQHFAAVRAIKSSQSAC